jgi:hypothetical protein
MESDHRLLAFVLSAPALLAQQPMQPPITPLQVNPDTAPAVITTAPGAIPVNKVAQLELRPQGTTGIYRATCSLVLATGTRPQLVSGTLNLGVVPPVWTPNADVAALNVPNTSHFQLSMSPDGLVVVWDNYTGVTATAFPNLPTGPHYAFVCARPSTTVPFSPASVQAMFVNRPPAGFYWTDMHLGDAPPLGGLYELFYSDATLGGPGDIIRAQVNPTTGVVSGASVVVTKPASVVYYHSPYDLRDSQGRLRALTFGQSLSTGANSDILWTRNATNNGIAYMVMDGSLPLPAPSSAPPDIWFSNGTTNGGTFTYGTYTTTQVEPYMVEHTLLVDSNVRPIAFGGLGQPVAAYAPIRPANGAVPSFLSWFGVSTALAPGPIALPGINGSLLLAQPALGVIGFAPHDNHTGLFEWTFAPYTPFWPPTTFPMQMITLDLATNQLTFSNVADFTM